MAFIHERGEIDTQAEPVGWYHCTCKAVHAIYTWGDAMGLELAYPGSIELNITKLELERAFNPEFMTDKEFELFVKHFGRKDG